MKKKDKAVTYTPLSILVTFTLTVQAKERLKLTDLAYDIN